MGVSTRRVSAAGGTRLTVPTDDVTGLGFSLTIVRAHSGSGVKGRSPLHCPYPAGESLGVATARLDAFAMPLCVSFTALTAGRWRECLAAVQRNM